MKDLIILVHGVGPFGGDLIPLKIRLKKMGYDAKIFSYSPWFQTLRHCSEKLNRFLTPYQDRRIHFVGHSFGGLVILRLFRDHRRYEKYSPGLNPGTARTERLQDPPAGGETSRDPPCMGKPRLPQRHAPLMPGGGTDR